MKHRPSQAQQAEPAPGARILPWWAFNVNWLNPADQPAQFGAAVVFAVLSTVGPALGLRALGRTMRVHKNDKGQLELTEGIDRTLPLFELIITAAVMAGAGVVMSFRIIGKAGPDIISKLAAILPRYLLRHSYDHCQLDRLFTPVAIIFTTM
jgi:hypothetical protein